MPDDDLRFGDVVPEKEDESYLGKFRRIAGPDPIEWMIQKSIQLMVLAIVLYAFYHVLISLIT